MSLALQRILELDGKDDLGDLSLVEAQLREGEIKNFGLFPKKQEALLF